MLRRFVLKIIIFAFPFLILFILMLNIGLQQGEAIAPEIVFVQQQRNHDLIYQPSWDREDIFFYKYTATYQIQPDILLLGSSRFFQWRPAYMFNGSTIAYNASVPSLEPIEIEMFVKELANNNHLPDIIFISLDYPFFNRDGNDVRANRVEAIAPSATYNYEYMLRGVSEIALHYFLQPYELTNIFQSHQDTNYLGEHARDTNQGFRYDGSFNIPNLDESRENLIQQQNDFYNNNNSIFQRGDHLYQPSLDAINNLLAVASLNDIVIIGVLSPYNDLLYDRMIDSGDFNYIPTAREEMQLLFSQHNMPFFDFTNLAEVYGSNDELYDYWHPGEVLSLRIYYRILLELPNIFAPYSNKDKIESYLEAVTHPLYLPPIDE